MKDFSKSWERVLKAVQKSESVSCSEQNEYTRVSSNVIKRKK